MEARYNPIHVTKYAFLFHWKRLKCILENHNQKNQVLTYYPITIEVNPIDYCNHDCSWCFTKSNRMIDRLDKHILLDLAQSIIEHGVASVHFSGGGESTIYPNLITKKGASQENSLTNKLFKENVTIGLITNGSMLNRLDLNEIVKEFGFVRVSLDASSEHTYHKLHKPIGHDFSDVFTSIRNLIHARGKSVHPALGCSFIYNENTTETADEIVKFCKIFAKEGVDFIQIKPENNNRGYEAQSFISAIEEKIQLSLNGSNTFVMVNAPHIKENSKYCWYSYVGPVVGATGDVYVCCYNYGHDDFCYGRMTDLVSFSDIWTSKNRLKIVDKIDPLSCDTCRHNYFNICIEKIMNNPEVSIPAITNVLNQLDNGVSLDDIKIEANISWLMNGFFEYQQIRIFGYNKMLDYPVYRPTTFIRS